MKLHPRLLPLLLTSVSSLFFAACSDPWEEEAASEGEEARMALRTEIRRARKRGAKVFTEHCAGCHGSDGAGGAQYPPLADSHFILGDPQRVALIIHKGIFGPITVGDKTYGDERMPGWEDTINAERTADLLTYLRVAWGNSDKLELEDQLIKTEQVEGWMEMAKDVDGPLPAHRIDSKDWKKILEET